MSVFKTAKSAPYFWFDFQLRGRRFHGSTRCTSRKEAEKVEATEKDKARAVLKAVQRSRASLSIDDVAARLWEQSAQYDAAPDASEKNFARLIDYFGKATL